MEQVRNTPSNHLTVDPSIDRSSLPAWGTDRQYPTHHPPTPIPFAGIHLLRAQVQRGPPPPLRLLPGPQPLQLRGDQGNNNETTPTQKKSTKRSVCARMRACMHCRLGLSSVSPPPYTQKHSTLQPGVAPPRRPALRAEARLPRQGGPARDRGLPPLRRPVRARGTLSKACLLFDQPPPSSSFIDSIDRPRTDSHIHIPNHPHPHPHLPTATPTSSLSTCAWCT